MSKCPMCQKEIDRLLHIQWGRNTRLYIKDPVGEGIAIEDRDFTSNSVGIFKCPACKRVLFEIEEEAEAFLKGTLQVKV